MKILFMCVANSARSQLAEGIARRVFPGAEVASAGSHPGKLNLHAVEVMREIGLDISNHYSKATDNLPPRFLESLDYVITLCAEEVCPVLLSKAKKLHWPLPDPAPKTPLPVGEELVRFRRARDSIHEMLIQFRRELECP